jgi:NAD+ kinase
MKFVERFCVITNSEKDRDYKISKEIKQFFEENGKSCIITKPLSLEHEVPSVDVKRTDASSIPPDTECAIILGGDGTFIQAANDLRETDIPMVGVNLGTLGYLTEIEKQKMFPAFKKLMKDDYTAERRLMLHGALHYDRDKNFFGTALNDIVVSKGISGRMISVELSINGQPVDTYVGDGVIISTPTGSTGYNLSAGGPILAPQVQAIIITPVCPHSLNNRSMVIDASDRVELTVGRTKTESADEAVVTVDGRLGLLLQTGDRIEIKKAEQETKILKLTDNSFYDVLKSKFQ